ncbi:hypothetical protein Hanom_Chr08g00724091 [Helianthus anomalus]
MRRTSEGVFHQKSVPQVRFMYIVRLSLHKAPQCAVRLWRAFLNQGTICVLYSF